MSDPRVKLVLDGDWPTVEELRMFRDRVIRIVDTTISPETGMLAIVVQYGCTHRKFPNIGPGGRWACGEMNCPHYVSKMKV